MLHMEQTKRLLHTKNIGTLMNIGIILEEILH